MIEFRYPSWTRCPRVFALLLILTQFPATAPAKEVDLTPVRKWIEGQSKLKSLYGTFIQERKLPRTVKRTFKKEGQFWYQAPGSVRWQIGKDPGDSIAVKNEREVLILEPKKQKMKRHTIQELKENEKLRGLAFIEAGFPRTLEAFQKGFQVTKIKHEENYYIVDTKIRDGKASLALTKLVFYIHDKDHALTAFRMYFRDKTTIYTRFTHMFPNRAVDKAVFHPDVSGYKEVE